MEIETQITVELIKAGGSVLTAAIPSVVSFYLGRKLMKSAKLKEDLKVALSDIRFLLAVEELHCREHKELEGQSKHLTMRKSVKAERQLDWSGKFSLSRITKKLEKLQ
ncbi:TPA: hypothetical protein ACGSTL_001339 [Vibrio parahaemolyticus]|uniref:hypothetical protein n=1 Tax=Vibrio campbellii TaxID=680 RepID=UPI001F07995A|nr:hypothetical protein [Vibrio campbellii]UMM06784.1 hypothetical protein MKR81_26350 [Vibrio campbellii]